MIFFFRLGLRVCFATILLQLPSTAYAVSTLEQIQKAVETEPQRPGLKLALAAHLIKAGKLDEAEKIVRNLIEAWPRSTRPKALLRAIDKLRNSENHKTALTKTRKSKSSVPDSSRTWLLKGSLGFHHDSIAGWDTTTSSAKALPLNAWRGQLGAKVQGNMLHGTWRYSGALGMDRTLHLHSDTSIHERDRSLISFNGSAEHTTNSQHRLGLRGDIKGALAGRPGKPHHFAGGLGASWSMDINKISPFVETRLWHFEFSPHANTSISNRVLRLAETSIGVSSQIGRFRLAGRTTAMWLEPYKLSGYTEVGSDLDAAIRFAPLVLRIRSGLGYRSFGKLNQRSSIRPRASIQLRSQVTKNVFLLLESHWRRATQLDSYLPDTIMDRWISGIQLEVAQ